MASLLENLGSKKRMFFLLVCAYVLVVLLWQLQSGTFHSLVTTPTEAVPQVVLNISSFNRGAEHVVDIHVEDPNLGHTGEIHGEHRSVSAAEAKKTVAIGGGITSAKIKSLTTSNVGSKLPIFKHLVPSFCKTASSGYHYHFYLGYDQNDPFFTKPEALKAFQAAFFQCIKKCPKELQQQTHIHFVQCSHSKKPGWAQNDAMMEAYIDDIEYYYRLNDDTEMQTGKWLEAFLKVLRGYSPPLVGVVGPKHKGGNEAILTYDFVHKTHVDIFGFYYPRLFTDWWADDWITKVYKPGRTTKLSDIKLKHTMELGQRYVHTKAVGPKVGKQIEADKQTLLRYLKAVEEKNQVVADGRKVVSMSLFSKDPKFTMGVIRNAQLLPVFLPGWTLRVYAADPHSTSSDLIVPERILNKLRSLKVQLAFVDPSKVTVSPHMWSMLVADDLEVDHFLVRDPLHRIGDRDATVVNFWLQTDRPFLSVKDHPDHAAETVVKGLWGGRPRDLNQLLRDPMYLTLQKSMAREEVEKKTSLLQKLGSILRNNQEDILGKYIWPLVRSRALCLDSISCETSEGCYPIPVKRNKNEYMGREFDQHQLPVAPAENIASPEACTNSSLKPGHLPMVPQVDAWSITVQNTPAPLHPGRHTSSNHTLSHSGGGTNTMLPPSQHPNRTVTAVPPNTWLNATGSPPKTAASVVGVPSQGSKILSSTVGDLGTAIPVSMVTGSTKNASLPDTSNKVIV